MSGSGPAAGDGGVLFEITQIGDVKRVAAVDAATGTEVVVQVPAATAAVDAHRLALRKLQRALGQSPNDVQVKPKTGRSGEVV